MLCEIYRWYIYFTRKILVIKWVLCVHETRSEDQLSICCALSKTLWNVKSENRVVHRADVKFHHNIEVASCSASLYTGETVFQLMILVHMKLHYFNDCRWHKNYWAKVPLLGDFYFIKMDWLIVPFLFVEN